MKTSRFAGELLVAAELSRLGLRVSLTNAMGFSTPGFDMMAANEDGDSVAVQVKSVKGPNSFLLDPERIKPKVCYVFVIVREAGELPSFWVARGDQLLSKESELFGKWGRQYRHVHGRGIASSSFPESWKGCWDNLGLGRFL